MPQTKSHGRLGHPGTGAFGPLDQHGVALGEERFPVEIGGFLGVWLGGKLYDSTGSYDVVWWIAIALGVFAALINLPVRETAIVRPVPQPV